jgi:hypothetical protein
MIKPNYSSREMFLHFCFLEITGFISTLIVTLSFIFLSEGDLNVWDRAFFALHAFGVGYFLWASAHAIDDFKAYMRRSHI